MIGWTVKKLMILILLGLLVSFLIPLNLFPADLSNVQSHYQPLTYFDLSSCQNDDYLVIASGFSYSVLHKDSNQMEVVILPDEQEVIQNAYLDHNTLYIITESNLYTYNLTSSNNTAANTRNINRLNALSRDLYIAKVASDIIDDLVEVLMNADISDEAAIEEEMKAVLDDYRITEQDWKNYIEGNPGVEEELANKMMEAMFSSMGEMNLEGR